MVALFSSSSPPMNLRPFLWLWAFLLAGWGFSSQAAAMEGKDVSREFFGIHHHRFPCYVSY